MVRSAWIGPRGVPERCHRRSGVRVARNAL